MLQARADADQFRAVRSHAPQWQNLVLEQFGASAAQALAAKTDEHAWATSRFAIQGQIRQRQAGQGLFTAGAI